LPPQSGAICVKEIVVAVIFVFEVVAGPIPANSPEVDTIERPRGRDTSHSEEGQGIILGEDALQRRFGEEQFQPTFSSKLKEQVVHLSSYLHIEVLWREVVSGAEGWISITTPSGGH
jgi:hypothetical protein